MWRRPPRSGLLRRSAAARRAGSWRSARRAGAPARSLRRSARVTTRRRCPASSTTSATRGS
eukprot:5621629-Pyramimonas_sp.AAC.1